MQENIAGARGLVDWARKAEQGARGGLAAARGLSPLARKGAFIAGGAFAGLLVAAVLPYAWYAGSAADLEGARASYELLQARAERLASGAAPRITEADHPEDMFLPGTTDGTTIAAFQSLVTERAGQSGLSVLRMQPLPSEPVKGLSPVRLAVDASGSLEQLRAFLADLEAGLPVVIVSGFDIVPAGAQGAEADPYPSENLAVTLRLEANVWRPTP